MPDFEVNGPHANFGAAIRRARSCTLIQTMIAPCSSSGIRKISPFFVRHDGMIPSVRARHLDLAGARHGNARKAPAGIFDFFGKHPGEA